MNNVRLKDSFVLGFKVSVGAFVALLAFTALVFNGIEISRADFVAKNKMQVCTISSGNIHSGKSPTYEFDLACPDNITRKLDVNDSEYMAMKVGQEITLYTAKSNGLFERFEPTAEWRDRKKALEWEVILIIFTVIGLVHWGIWVEAKRELERLRNASILDAEILGISVYESKVTTANARLRFMAKGKPFEGVFPTNPTQMNDHFQNRTVKVAVNEEDPAKSKILSMFTTVELIP